MFGWIKNKSSNIVDTYKSGLQEFAKALDSDIKTVYQNTHQEQTEKDDNAQNFNLEQEMRKFDVIAKYLQEYHPSLTQEEIQNILHVILISPNKLINDNNKQQQKQKNNPKISKQEIEYEDLIKDPNYIMLQRHDFTNYHAFLEIIGKQKIEEKLINCVEEFDSDFLIRYLLIQNQDTDVQIAKQAKIRFFYILIYKIGVQSLKQQCELIQTPQNNLKKQASSDQNQEEDHFIRNNSNNNDRIKQNEKNKQDIDENNNTIKKDEQQQQQEQQLISQKQKTYEIINKQQPEQNNQDVDLEKEEQKNDNTLQQQQEDDDWQIDDDDLSI